MPARSVAEAAKESRHAALVAMRDTLAEAMDVASSGVVAQVAARLQAVLAEIDELSSGKQVTSLDELESRRQDRLAAAGVPDAAKRQTRQSRPRSG